MLALRGLNFPMPDNNSALQTILQFMDNPVEQQNIEVPSQKKNWSNHLLSNSLYLFFCFIYYFPLAFSPSSAWILQCIITSTFIFQLLSNSFWQRSSRFSGIALPNEDFSKVRTKLLSSFILSLLGGGRGEEISSNLCRQLK